MAVELWALSDLHLGPGAGKGHFSSSWKDHQPRIRAAWDARIPSDAVVLMPGDFSWHQDPADLKYDYHWIDDRPGLKILSPGNHDYGVWTDHDQADAFVSQFRRMRALYGRAIRLEHPEDPDASGLVILSACGTAAPEDKYFNSNGGVSSGAQETEIVRFFRELALLSAAIDEARTLRREGDRTVAMLHYPPFADGAIDSVWSKAMERAGVDLCLYGHLHQDAQWRAAVQGQRNGVEYRFVGADFLDFKPVRVGEWTRTGVSFDEVETTKKPSAPAARARWEDDDDYYEAYSAITPGSPLRETPKPSPSVAPTRPTTPASDASSRPTTPASAVRGSAPVAEGLDATDAAWGSVAAKAPSGQLATRAEATPVELDGFYTDVDGTRMVDARQWSDVDTGSYRASDLQLDAEGRPQTCVGCGQLITEGEQMHEVSDGVVHGLGSVTERDTCAYVHDAADEAAETTGGAAVSDDDFVLDAHGIVRSCAECGEHLKRDEPWHQSARGPLHGASVVNGPAACAESDPVDRSAATLDAASRVEAAAGHPVKTGMNCLHCSRRILKTEPWHNVADGKVHGWGSFNDAATCHKVVATGWKPGEERTIPLAKPVAAHSGGHGVYGGYGYGHGYGQTGTYRPSNLTKSEAGELDGWADGYLAGSMTMDELRSRAERFVTRTKDPVTTSTVSKPSTPSVSAPSGFQSASRPPEATATAW